MFELGLGLVLELLVGLEEWEQGIADWVWDWGLEINVGFEGLQYGNWGLGIGMNNVGFGTGGLSWNMNFGFRWDGA